MGNNASGLNFFSSMTLVIISIIAYQIFQKNISGNINPIVSVIITYAIALVFSFLLLFIFPVKNGFLMEIQKANYASYFVGIAIIGIEIGFLIVYRNGWKFSSAMPFSSSISIVVLTLIGFFFFKEHLNFTKIVGITLCVTGIFLLNK